VSSCLVVQHVEAEGSCAIGGALSSAGVGVDTRRVFAGDVLPGDVSAFDGLVVMGGPMSAVDDAEFPTRIAELDLMADALARGIPTLGVCLGAQILAVAAGGSVFVGGAGPEIGWDSVDFTAEAISDPLLSAMPSRVNVLHWHGDTFALPPNAIHLASSPKYVNQAFRIGESAWGIQFHFEVDHPAVTKFLDAFGEEVRSAGQTPDDIALATQSCLEELAPFRARMCDRFAQMVVQHERDKELVDFG
jgi:GMP synthase-like glutamine amidotransferase